MKKDRPIEKAVEESLRSLDDLQKADPGPWFATRVIQRWEEGSQKQSLVFWLRPRIQLAALAILFVLNLGYFFLNQSTQNERESTLQTFSEQYNLNTASQYQIYQEP